MGIFSFLKNAGAKIFGGKSAPATPAAPSQDVLDAAETQRETLLMNLVNSMNLPVSNLAIEVDGDTVIVTGDADTTAAAEKVVLTLGNVDGVAQVDNRLNVLNVEPDAQFYTVEKGDSLSKIAKEYYGDYMKYPVIFEANRPMLTHPDLIYPGQVLRIPAVA